MASVFDMLLAQVRRKVHKPIYTSPSRNYEMQHAVRQAGKKQKKVVTPLEEQALADDCKIDVNETKYVNQQILKSQDICEIKELVTERNERTVQELENEDLLLSQIDEFREKAKQLQDLLLTKESKAQELQTLVNERQDRAQELEQLLNARKEEANQIMRSFNQKVDDLAAKVTGKMAEMELSISNQVLEAKNASVAQLEANRKLNEEQMEASKKLSEEQLEKNKQFLEEQAIANKKLSEGQIAEVKVLLDTATNQLDSIKIDLSEKVHSENVKCYRNIQDLFNEFDSKIEKMDAVEKGVDSIRGYVKCLTWFSIINFIVLIGFILYSLGVFNF